MSARALAGPLRARIAPLALAAGVLVGVVLPAVYQRSTLEERAGQARTWAQELAGRLEVLAVERPRLWAYDQISLGAIARSVARPPVDAFVRIDAAGVDGAFAVGPAGRADEVTGWAPIRAGEAVIGRVQVRLPATLARTRARWLWLGAGLFGLLLAMGLYLLPMAAVRRGDARNAELWSALAEANRTLEARVLDRTAELRAREQELSELGARLVRVQEEERARISRDLHDDVGQTMTALRLRLTTAEAVAPPASPTRPHLEAALSAVDAGVEQIRRLAHNLRPPALDALGLPAALTAHAERWAEAAGLDLDLDVDPHEPPAAVAEVLFRIAQEALTNVARHARAERVAVTCGPFDDGWRLVVEDDGEGRSAAANPRQGLGLVGARERAEQAGGYLDVGPSPSGGLRLSAWLPQDL